MRSIIAVVGVAALVTPSQAWAYPPMSIGNLIAYTSIPLKLVLAILIVAMIAAVVITWRKLREAGQISGGSAFLQALRLGGPLFGLLGAAYNVLSINIAIANIGGVAYPVLAPTVAEALLITIAGLVAGIIGVICNWLVEAKVDRTVLRG